MNWTLAAAGLGLGWAASNALANRRRIEFAGKVVLLSGGSRGLGFVMARQLLDEGAKVVMSGRDKESLFDAEVALEKYGDRLYTVPCDVTDVDSVRTLVQAALDHFGHIDVLINNAGTIQVGPMDTMGPHDFDVAMKTHFWGPLHLSLAVLPHFRERKAGRIVNVSSIGGKVSIPHMLPYSASKFALTGFSEGLTSELRAENIFVTTVCPGLMRTGSPRNAYFKGEHRLEYAWFSVADSLPGLSMKVSTAARKIIEACRYGQAELVLGLPTKLVVSGHALFPNFVSFVLAQVNRALPGAGQAGTEAFKGKESESFVSPSVLTASTEKAAEETNQFRSDERAVSEPRRARSS